MRRLILLRHAKAARSAPGEPDADRPLDARGREAAPLMGSYVARHRLTPVRAVVSPSRRTRETWELFSAALSPRPEAAFDARLYAASPQSLLDVVRETPAATQSLLILGHNPGMHAFAMLLVGTGAIEPRQRLADKFPTAAMAVIDFAAQDWNALHFGGGRLDRFVGPRVLSAATD